MGYGIDVGDIDCSQISKNYYEIAEKQGKIIVFRDANAPWLSGPEKHLRGKFNTPFKDFSEFYYPQSVKGGETRETRESYHALYTDGRYFYDGGLHNDGIPIGDYMKLIKFMNEITPAYRVYNPETGELMKGKIYGK
ncbi:hypothetical protein [Vibrio quintilis]|uniref:Uncharacterized protein n=1 Tax=Vibrio quintilis TaxID=1117707 RepID=A0A1M7Z1X6_9VIBR|nr:hypothetical protein [Vibrio quintilis]SHO58969.1 hypothetical protein VQ7734_04744 [Vibrio quintilis]